MLQDRVDVCWLGRHGRTAISAPMSTRWMTVEVTSFTVNMEGPTPSAAIAGKGPPPGFSPARSRVGGSTRLRS